jgi:hypothetical protein
MLYLQARTRWRFSLDSERVSRAAKLHNVSRRNGCWLVHRKLLALQKGSVSLHHAITLSWPQLAASGMLRPASGHVTLPRKQIRGEGRQLQTSHRGQVYEIRLSVLMMHDHGMQSRRFWVVKVNMDSLGTSAATKDCDRAPRSRHDVQDIVLQPID